MKDRLVECQDKVLKILAGKINDFYLAGGTALSRFYFQHRISDDLDFFALKFFSSRVQKIKEEIEKGARKKLELVAEQTGGDKIRMIIFNLPAGKKLNLRIDFVEDYIKPVSALRFVDGIYILSLEDIYLRKIDAVSGTGETIDITGRRVSTGAREEVKDFCDLYFLSQTFQPLADFAAKYTNRVREEGLIRWFRTYNRLEMKTGLLELKLKRPLDYRDMEEHFKKQIDKLIEREVEFI